MVKELLEKGFSEDEVVRIYVDNGFEEPLARQILALELGREDAGCLVELDEP